MNIRCFFGIHEPNMRKISIVNVWGDGFAECKRCGSLIDVGDKEISNYYWSRAWDRFKKDNPNLFR